MRRRTIQLIVLSLVAVIVASCPKENPQVTQSDRPDTSSPITQSRVGSTPTNVRLTNQAWEALNNQKYESAITYADRCIQEFHGGALRKQRELEEQKTPLPPTGQVSEKDKETIFSQGLINDVATCLFIKGKSMESLGRKKEAIEVYQAASKLTYGRCWDPQGWFWSPAESSGDRLSTLK